MRRRANQRHDAIIAARVISGVLAEFIGNGPIQPHALLDKQKEGKLKMPQFGKVDIPQEAFVAALKVDS